MAIKDLFLGIVLSLLIFLIVTIAFPFYLLYSVIKSLIEAIISLFQCFVDYFETVRDCMKGNF